MKKLIYSLLALSLVFTACNPMEEVYEELDALGNSSIVGDVVFTMTTEDYELTGNSDVESAEAFISFAQAETLIPTMLSAKYPVWGEGSSALVSFDYDLLSSVINEVAYQVTPADYTAQGFSFPNFGSGHTNDALAFLSVKYPSAVRGDMVELTYQFWNGSLNDVTAKFVYTDEWIAPYEVTSADYTAMGQRFSNFDNFDEAAFKLGIYLGTLPENLYAQAGETKKVLYTYTYRPSGQPRQFEDVLLSFTYDGSKWSTDTNTIQFGLESTGWVKDNTIKYTFTAADYATVGSSSVLAADASFADALDNLNNFGNFNRTGGGTSWSDEMMIKAIGVVLNSINGSAADGQKYVVTVSIYDGSSGVESFAVIKTNGEWVAQ